MSSPASSASSLSPPPSPPSYTALDAASAARSGASFLAWPSDEPYYPTSSASTPPPSSQTCTYSIATAVPSNGTRTNGNISRNYHHRVAAAYEYTYHHAGDRGGGQDSYYAPREAASDAASGACFVAAWPGEDGGHHPYGAGSSGRGHGHHGGKGAGKGHGRQQGGGASHKGAGLGAGKKGVVAVAGSRNK